MAFKPKNYQEALEKKQLRDGKRKPKERKQWESTTKSSKKRKPLRSKPDPKLISWSKEVRKRDDYTCQVTGVRDVENNIAHHIAPRGRRIDLKYEVSNGITVTRVVHYWIHFVDPVEATRRGLLSDETYESQNSMRNNP